MQSFHFKDNGFVRLCGHRGHSLGAPENTISALRAAHDFGASSMEIDTVLTADQQIVVLHDLLVDRTTDGTGAVKDLSAADIAKLDAGSWYDPHFAGERIPTLRDVLDLAHELDLVLEVEVKEKLHLDAYTAALKTALADPRDLSRVMMISFDHAHLKAIKAAIPGIRTGGIVHERYADPVVVARSADLDELCIDLSAFEAADAAVLHAAGIAIRCHAYSPQVLARVEKAGLGWTAALVEYLRAGLIDTLSGDDVAWLQRFAAEHEITIG